MKITWFLLVMACTPPIGEQDEKVGGPCEGCEAIYESPVPFEKLEAVTQLPDATWAGKKPLGINGTVYKADGKTPTPGVIVYIYHTDETGHYTAKADAKGWEKRHWTCYFLLDKMLRKICPIKNSKSSQTLVLKLSSLGSDGCIV